MRIQTVNVVQMADGELLGIAAFKDNKTGNKEAEDHFRKILLEEDVPEENIDSYIEDGYWEDGGYEMMISHSE